MNLRNLKLKWFTLNKTINYLEKNKELSYLDRSLYNFIKQLYLYLINPNDTTLLLEKLYVNYINLINISLRNNRESTNQRVLDSFLHRSMFIIDREAASCRSFILANTEWHHKHLREAITRIRLKSTPEYYGYMDWEEFKEELKTIKNLFKKKKEREL